MLDAPDAALESMRADLKRFEDKIVEGAAEGHFAQASLPDRRALGFLLFDAKGSRIEYESPGWTPPFLSREELIQHVDPRSSDGRLLCVTSKGFPQFGIWAPYSETQHWNLPAGLRQQAVARQADALAIFAGNVQEPIDGAVAAFGLNPFEQRVVASLIRTGDLKRAASQINVTYGAAREAMVAAMRRLNLSNTPAVVRTVVAAAFGVLPKDAHNPDQLADMLCISERQAQIALLIASGASREATAQTLRVSKAVIKKELQTIFAIFDIRTAAELARVVTEVQALRLFARSIDNAPGFLDPAIEPSRYSVRSDGDGTIAWSDYGPASGKPVLVVHSNWCCRAVPLPLVKELQRRGWRPLAIDRPGFGATHLGTSSVQNPFDQAILDLAQILDSQNIGRIPVIARCGAQFTHAFAASRPSRIGPVVLVSPTPKATQQGKVSGPVGAFKEAFFRSPRLVEVFFRVISAQMSFERVGQLMRSITRDAEVDTGLCSDPQFIRDRFRALRPFACGNYLGGIVEEHVISHGGWDFRPIDGAGWTILQGDQDYHNDFAEVREYWTGLLPGSAMVKVAGGGRFMTSSHPVVVVDALESNIQNSGLGYRNG